MAPEAKEKPGVWGMAGGGVEKGDRHLLGAFWEPASFPKESPLTLKASCKAGINFIPF